MSETWQEIIDVDYTYDCPTDNYLDGPSVESITENYNGPARLVALVDKETNLVEVTLREWEAYDGRPERVNCNNVVIDCSVDTLLCEVLSDYHNAHLDHPDLNSDPPEELREMKSISTPDGYSEFTWHYPIHPDELYDDRKTTYEDGTWTLYKQTNLDVLGGGVEHEWSDTRRMRNGMLAMTDSMVAVQDGDANFVDRQQKVVDMRQKLRDMPEALASIDSVFVPSSFPPTDILKQD